MERRNSRWCVCSFVRHHDCGAAITTSGRAASLVCVCVPVRVCNAPGWLAGWLAGWLTSALTHRPNIVVAGGRAFQEDDWAELVVGAGENVFQVVKPCTRCTMINIDQKPASSAIGAESSAKKNKPNSAALADPRIFATLAKYRRRRGSLLCRRAHACDVSHICLLSRHTAQHIGGGSLLLDQTDATLLTNMLVVCNGVLAGWLAGMHFLEKGAVHFGQYVQFGGGPAHRSAGELPRLCIGDVVVVSQQKQKAARSTGGGESGGRNGGTIRTHTPRKRREATPPSSSLSSSSSSSLSAAAAAAAAAAAGTPISKSTERDGGALARAQAKKRKKHERPQSSSSSLPSSTAPPGWRDSCVIS